MARAPKPERRAYLSRSRKLSIEGNAEVGGKAGRTFFPIFVGQNEYLHKSSKTARRVQVQQDTIDLHGCTRDEALQRLNSALPI